MLIELTMPEVRPPAVLDISVGRCEDEWLVTVGTADSAAQDERVSAYLEAALDCVVMAEASGRVVEFNPAAERTFGYTREEALGRTLAELIVPPSLRERHSRAFARFVETREQTLFGRRLELTGMRADGSEFPVELALSLVEGESLLICGALRDLTPAKRAEDDLHKLADEQAALRRVATLAAEGAGPAEVFAAVAEEVARVVGGVPAISMIRFESGGTATKIAGWGESSFPVGSSWTMEDPSVMASVLQTGRPARIDDYANVLGSHAKIVSESGMRSGVGVPIVVDSGTWGAVIAFSKDPEPLTADAEDRLARFTELVATAISNTEARDDLRRLADEQAALRRVATLVARELSPADVFAVVAQEAAALLDAPLISMVRYEPDETATVVAASREHPFPVGTNLMLDGPSIIASVFETGRPARRDDYAELPGTIARRVQEAGIQSAVGVPIVVDRKTWGAMVAVAPGAEPLPEDTESRLAGFTELVAAAILNAQARDDLRLVVAEQAALRRVATLVGRGTSPSEVFASVVEEVGVLLQVDVVNMVRHEIDDTATVVGSWSAIGGTIPLGSQLRLGGPSIMGSVSRTGRPARIDSYAEIPGAITYVVEGVAIQAGVGVPIVVEGRVWGTVVALSAEPGPLPDSTEKRLAGFTELVAAAILNSEARDHLRLIVDEQTALRRVATLVAQGAEPDEVFAAVAEEAAQVLDVPLVQMSRYVSDDTVTVVGMWGEQPFPPGSTWPLDGPTLSAQVLQTGQPARIDDYSCLPGTIGRVIREAGIHAGVGAPIVVDRKLWGVMMVLSTEPKPLPGGTEARLTDFTELVATAISNAQARDDLRLLIDEQAALRRVATLVARRTDSHAVFDAVCAETGQLIGASTVNLAHFTPDRLNLTMAGWSLRDTHIPTGTRLALSADTINGVIQRTGAPARFDSYEGASGELASLIRQRGIRSEVGAPVIVEGQIWGALIAGTDTDEPLPAGAQLRVASFAELIATAVSNTIARSELIASRARIVTAGDEARRRIERNLHDGTQQRLVALALDLQAVGANIPTEQEEAHASLRRIGHELEAVLEDVRELSRGLHPALLSQGGLGPSLRALARRSPIPIELDVDVAERPPEPIEIAVYYVVSEALANTAKHGKATEASVTVEASGDLVRATIQDDGVGGAEASGGSGLIGLIDRVEALGGRFALDSPPGKGTQISIELPLAAWASAE
jgi:PAS domain S-box-containing protein